MYMPTHINKYIQRITEMDLIFIQRQNWPQNAAASLHFQIKLFSELLNANKSFSVFDDSLVVRCAPRNVNFLLSSLMWNSSHFKVLYIVRQRPDNNTEKASAIRRPLLRQCEGKTPLLHDKSSGRGSHLPRLVRGEGRE